MPKAPPSSSSNTARSSAAPFQSPQVLRRNQACHQCRRRKLKCDAKRPCSTCRRSHSYAVAHAPPGTDLPPHPECTFDELPEPAVAESQEPKNKVERLENRITELEALLREKHITRPDGQALSEQAGAESIFNTSALFSEFNDSFGFHDGSQVPLGHVPTASALDELAGLASLMGSNPFDALSSGFERSNSQAIPKSWGFDVSDPSWPRNLPNHSLLRQLIEAFFTFTPLADRLFHMPSFMSLLSLPTTHPKFPFPAILHGMCALGSMYAPDVAPSPGNSGYSYDGLGSVFAEIQIKAAKEAIDLSMRAGPDLFACLQAQIVIAMWYWYNARWPEACVGFSTALRHAIPCGLNMCAPFDSILSSNTARPSVIPNAGTPYEEETRRNAFWIAYMLERHFSAINNFAMFLDDEDISQMLPVSGDSFEAGILVPSETRQWCHNPKIFEEHDDQIDSFGLHLKSVMLLSRVKVFNTRFKIKRHLGDPNYLPHYEEAPSRRLFMLTVPAFKELSRLCNLFLENLPPHLKNPVANGVVDVSLLTAISNAYFAVIILHEGHASIGVDACVASCRILAASRSILNLLHEVYSSGHNLALMGVLPMVCWFAAGRVLIRFLRAAMEAKSEEHVTILQTEVEFIRSVISGIGETVPHAVHYGKMLDEYLAQACGRDHVARIPTPPASRAMDMDQML